MPYPYLIYITINLMFNIVLLILLKYASALQGFMAIKAVLPFAFLLFYIKWPLLEPSKFNIWIVVGLLFVIAGLIFYRLFTYIKTNYPKQTGCFSVFLPFCMSEGKDDEHGVQ